MYPSLDEKIMLEKRYGRRTPLPMYNSAYTDASRSRTRRSVFAYAIMVLVIFTTVLYGIPKMFHMYSPSQPEVIPGPRRPTGLRKFIQPSQTASTTGSTALTEGSNATTLVALEAHIMSKCPDARDCLRDLVVPAMQQVVDKVDFQLSYIGSTDGDGNIQCMHGPTECLGNMMGLCAQQLYPNDVKRWLGFSTCLITDYQRIPDKDLAHGCALEHGIDFENLNSCMSEEGTGLNLLESSVQRSEKAGVKKSCTVRVAGEIWCIRDGGEWKDCPNGHEVSDLVKDVETRYGAD